MAAQVSSEAVGEVAEAIALVLWIVLIGSWLETYRRARPPQIVVEEPNPLAWYYPNKLALHKEPPEFSIHDEPEDFVENFMGNFEGCTLTVPPQTRRVWLEWQGNKDCVVRSEDGLVHAAGRPNGWHQVRGSVILDPSDKVRTFRLEQQVRT